MPSSIHIIELDPKLEVLRALAAFESERFVLLLDSAARHRERDARYSILTADPVDVFRIDRAEYGDSPFETLRRWQALLTDLKSVEQSGLPPFCGGIAGLMSYELGHAFEQLPRPAIDDFQTPALLAGLFDWSIVWDHIKGTVRAYVLQMRESDNRSSAARRVLWILERLSDVAADVEPQGGASSVPEATASGNKPDGIRAPDERKPASASPRLMVTEGTVPVARATGTALPLLRSSAPGCSSVPDIGESELTESAAASPSRFLKRHRIEPSSEIYSDFTRDEYTSSVSRVIEYIRAGDIFQANLSQRLMAPWTGTVIELYAGIRANNPAPFCGLLQTPEYSIISASPERFLKVDGRGNVETRPIKGTRRRPHSPIADLYAGSELAASEKDRAENVMIVDLLRNDLSRSCVAGSVKVTGLCEIERFETVLHLVSTIVGRLRPDRDVWDLMAGCFPGGSITGAPKIRAMEIISELEPTVRGAYCGSLFALGPCGDFDSSILIRTFTLKQGWLQFPVGGGIIADSDPLDEYRETLHKASGMIRSLRSMGRLDRPAASGEAPE